MVIQEVEGEADMVIQVDVVVGGITMTTIDTAVVEAMEMIDTVPNRITTMIDMVKDNRGMDMRMTIIMVKVKAIEKETMHLM